MQEPTLQDHLRRLTRNFTTRLPEDQVLALGLDLARELARAHAETPARHPELEPSAIRLREGRPVLEGSRATADGELVPTLAGLLAFGRYPQQYFPQLNVSIVRYPTPEAGVPTDRVMTGVTGPAGARAASCRWR